MKSIEEDLKDFGVFEGIIENVEKPRKLFAPLFDKLRVDDLGFYRMSLNAIVCAIGRWEAEGYQFSNQQKETSMLQCFYCYIRIKSLKEQEANSVIEKIKTDE